MTGPFPNPDLLIRPQRTLHPDSTLISLGATEVLGWLDTAALAQALRADAAQDDGGLE
jgi:hypothetical protein